jgi:hypothetical protein
MIDEPTYAGITRDVHKVQRGDWLTSDRVADRIDELWAVVSGLGMHGKNWDEAVRLDPKKARMYQDHVLELQFLLRQIHDHHVDEAAIAAAYSGQTRDITAEVGDVR